MPKSESRSPKGEKRGRGGERTEKFSRSTIACNGCRTRKQKCGGEKPICLRCRTLNKTCVWPEQLKRGPSKGYNESLELRLHETETLLVALLATVTEAQLSALTAFDIPDGDVTPSASEKKAKLDEWTNFPLRTAEDMLKWRDERLSKDGQYRTSIERRTGSVEPMAEISGGPAETAGGAMEMEVMDQGMQGMDEVRIEHHLGSMVPMEHIQAAEFENYLPHVGRNHSTSTARSPSMSPGSGMLGISKEFKDTFLW